MKFLLNTKTRREIIELHDYIIDKDKIIIGKVDFLRIFRIDR